MRRKPARPVDMRAVRRALRSVFGLDDFRPGQAEVVRAVLERRHTLAIMPTGAGKSLCYQLAALQLPGTTLVISPLIALMKDQADKLNQLGLAAVQVNSAFSEREQSDAIETIISEQSKLALTTAERVTQPEFLAKIEGLTVDLVVIDEAHCISEWGHDFRPAYIEIKHALQHLGRPTVLALTATATPEVIEDIQRQLALPKLHVIRTGIYRPNLDYSAALVENGDAKSTALGRVLDDVEGAGIVYAATVREVEMVTTLLKEQGVAAERYHGRLSAKERHATQDQFMAGELRVIVATNAFGMGIDKPDIRFVCHFSMPGTLDAYYQESGRGGRDGEPARCVLFHQPEDKRPHLFFLGGKYPTFPHVAQVHAALVSLGADTTPARLETIQAAAAGVPKTKVRAVLSLLAELDVVHAQRGRFALTATELGQAEVDALSRRYDERRQSDRAKLDLMIAYAQSSVCRWRLLLAAFGETLAGDGCGHCDNCRKGIEKDVLAAHGAA